MTSTTTDDDLNEYFSQYGKLSDYIVIKGERRDDDRMGRGQKISRGFGYVSYENVKDRNVCLQNIPHTLDGKKVIVETHATYLYYDMLNGVFLLFFVLFLWTPVCLLFFLTVRWRLKGPFLKVKLLVIEQ